MLRNFHQEVEQARKNLTETMQTTLPSKQFSTTMMLVLVHLAITKETILTTTNLQERGEHINEFNRARSAIKKGIKLLGNATGSFRRGRGNMPELRQHLQDCVAKGRS